MSDWYWGFLGSAALALIAALCGLAYRHKAWFWKVFAPIRFVSVLIMLGVSGYGFGVHTSMMAAERAKASSDVLVAIKAADVGMPILGALVVLILFLTILFKLPEKSDP